MPEPRRATNARTQQPAAGNRQQRPGAADQVAGAMLLPLAVARRVLPRQELPVYLGVGALAVVGVIEWPVAVGAGLGYAALRRWGPLH